MQGVAVIAGLVLIMVVLWEGFETVVLPRRVTRRFRLTRLFYRVTWLPYARAVAALLPRKRQESWLSVFGPLSLLLLLALWLAALITGFALLQRGVGVVQLGQDGSGGFLEDLYLSCTTFFTLGMGDVVPKNGMGRLLVALETGLGFGFLALLIGYLPALNQSFSRREVNISLLDARAGSPPTASEMLRRHGHERGSEALRQLLHEWERWCAELLEGHLSYPVLAYFRSQHDNQSWLAALTAILDTSALILSGVEGACLRQAELTFAMGRHALVDLSLVFRIRQRHGRRDRLSPEQLARLNEFLSEAGIRVPQEGFEPRLAELRAAYEPYLQALSAYFRLPLPPFVAESHWVDNWQASARDAGLLGRARQDVRQDEHF